LNISNNGFGSYYVIYGKSRIYQIGRVSHRPSFNWTETWNHATWLHDE